MNASHVNTDSDFLGLRILHGENGTFVDRTSSHDVTTRTVCATVNSLSPFVLARRLLPPYSVLRLDDVTRPHRRGSTIPVKIRVMNGYDNASATALTVVATGILFVTTSTNGTLQDAGSANPDYNFRFDSSLKGYVFNLSTTGFATGTYELQIRIGENPKIHTTSIQVR